MLGPEEVERVGQALLSEVVKNLSIPHIRLAVAAAGLNATAIPATSEARSGMALDPKLRPQSLQNGAV